MKQVILLSIAFLFSLGLLAQEREEVRYNQYGVPVDRQQVRAEERSGILVFESLNQSYRLWFDIRVQLDAAAFWGKPKDFDAIGNGASVRRARFAVKSKLNNQWYGEIDTDFSNGLFELKDAVIEYTGLENFAFKAGNFKEDFSMEQTTSSRYLAFIERPMAVQTFSPSRHLGVQAEYTRKLWRASFGVFGQVIDNLETLTYVQDNNKDYGRSEGISYTAKVNLMPVSEDRTRGLHLGAAASYRTPKTDVETYGATRFSGRNSTSINRKKYLDTDDIKDVDHDFLYGFELAGFCKGLRFQSEYIGNETHIKETAANNTTKRFGGWYAQAGYLLFGGQHRYDSGSGEFTQPSRGREWGDVELLARYDFIDLNSADIFGGSGENYAVGATYYINNSVKFVLNYQYTKNDRYANGKNKLIIGHDAAGVPTKDFKNVVEAKGKAGVRYNMLALRMEVDF
ncbi:MAG: porin [Odoribacteraceae bacterium]|jgi:phosphate-selective porin OprO/OprP|nr:porin [Odoribacteraceae bacterium]